jgi:hypothetical protein
MRHIFIYVGISTQGIHIEVCWGNLLGDAHLEDREEGQILRLKYLSGKSLYYEGRPESKDRLALKIKKN